MKQHLTFICILLSVLAASVSRAQFAPQVPLAGNEGIIYTDNRIEEWANGCTITLGWLNIADKSLGQPTFGTSNAALGPSDDNIVSLGDSGVAVVTFPYTIRNGEGPDFAVYENGFPNPLDANMAYLEFAFVEVSSDGINFVRFPATCNIQDTAQTDNFSYSDASLVNNLAGKYISGYGTPFDLEELKGTPGLDVDHISHVRLVDVVGSIDPAYGSADKSGHLINDPYPSVYPSGGFDLNAVAVLNSNKPATAINELARNIQLQYYPNPVSDYLSVDQKGREALHFTLTDLSGQTLSSGTFTGNTRISLAGYPAGLYLLAFDNGKEKSVVKVTKQ